MHESHLKSAHFIDRTSRLQGLASITYCVASISQPTPWAAPRPDPGLNPGTENPTLGSVEKRAHNPKPIGREILQSALILDCGSLILEKKHLNVCRYNILITDTSSEEDFDLLQSLSTNRVDDLLKQMRFLRESKAGSLLHPIRTWRGSSHWDQMLRPSD